MLRDLYEKLGRTPLASEVPQRVTIRIRFGSWENALRKGGIPINKPKKTKYENDELLEILQEKMLKNMDALQDTKRFNNQH
ncbi:homing endonuclease associated repeat-containing protein [Bacillus velezensis]|uniref:homing endonuclease associated repeat-containing protein n=1 Tax=Bacillus velezensis TaxID=492670 RepID=UPI003B516269